MSRSTNFPLQLLLLYAVFIIYATIIPFAFDTPPESFVAKFEALLADPLQFKASRGFALADIVSNVLLFIPLGMLLGFARLQSAPKTSRAFIVLLATCASLLMSGLVEFMQFFSERRVVSFIDCLMNGLGATIGAVLALQGGQRSQVYWQRVLRSRFAQTPELKLFNIYAALLVFAQLLPLHPTLDVSTIKKNLKATELTLPQTPSALGDLFAETILYAGFAFLWLRAQSETKRARVILQAIGLTTGVAFALEGAQLFLVGHVIRLRNLLAGLEGGLYGAATFILAQMRVTHQPRAARSLCERKLMLELALGHLLAYIFLLELKPYDFAFRAASFAQFEWLPFIEYYRNTNTHAVADLGEGLALFALLGMLMLARLNLRPNANQTSNQRFALGASVGLGLVLEALQLGFAQHAHGVTDCVNAALGAGLGIWLWRKFFGVGRRHFQISSRRTRALTRS